MIGLAGPYDFLPAAASDVKAIFGPEATWPRSQPINYVTARAPQMLLLAGKADRTVDPDNTLRLAARLRAAGASVHAELDPGVGHIAVIAAFSDWLSYLAPVRERTLGFVSSPGRCRE